MTDKGGPTKGGTAFNLQLSTFNLQPSTEASPRSPRSPVGRLRSTFARVRMRCVCSSLFSPPKGCICLVVVLLAALAHPPAVAAAGGPGTVYLVLGSDADAWNVGLTPGTYGTTVDTHLPHPYYPPGLFTHPG